MSTEQKCWALCCVPDVYDARGAVTELDELCWTLDRGRPMPGDKLILWQSKGKAKNGRRGIIAIGEVILPPGMMEESEQEKKHWRGPPEPDLAFRTRFRVLRVPNMPLWEDEHFELLSNLNVAKARGGTVFSVTPEQWEAVRSIARNEPETLLNEAAAGQGFGLTAAERKIVEQHAQSMATAYFGELGYDVEDRSLTEACDLRCSRGEEILFVEVKGTTGAGDTIFLTRNEVALSQKNPLAMALFLVRNITLKRSGSDITASGGDQQVIMPWNVDKFDLESIQFQCRVARG